MRWRLNLFNDGESGANNFVYNASKYRDAVVYIYIYIYIVSGIKNKNITASRREVNDRPSVFIRTYELNTVPPSSI